MDALAGGTARAKHRYTAEAIIHPLADVDVLLGLGSPVADESKSSEVAENTHFCYRNPFGEHKVDQPNRLKELELEIPTT